MAAAYIHGDEQVTELAVVQSQQSKANAANFRASRAFKLFFKKTYDRVSATMFPIGIFNRHPSCRWPGSCCSSDANKNIR
jgi:hypothetical protein